MNEDHDRPGDVIAALLEHSRELLMVLHDDGRIAFLSPPAQRCLGGDKTGRSLVDLVHPEDRAAVGAAVAAHHGNVTCRLVDSASGWRRVGLAITDQRAHHAIGGLVCLAHEIGDHGDVAAHLIHQATHDTLTSLPNRAHLLDQLAADAEHGRTRPAALLYLDLDGFKAVNDTLGHAAGDRVLVAVADRIRRAVRPGDSVARFGGDEFVILANGVSDGDVALDVANRIIAAVARPVAVCGRLVSVSASIGIALNRGTATTALIDDADRAMYQAKHEGRNRAVLYHQDLRTGDQRRHDIAEMLRSALDDDGVTVAFQPVVNLGTGRLAAVEAVLRLPRPDGTVGLTGELIGVAEETGLAVAVGAGLLDHACAQLATWDRERGHESPALLIVPVSSRQLRGPRAATQIAAILGARGVAPGRLCLQIREDALVEADSAVCRTLEELKGVGVALAVDDFGGGRTSLTYLRRFSVDMLCIDRSLMAGLGHDDGDTEVIRSIVGLGQALGITTVARGVEDGGQAELLTELGCRLAQGFWFGRPGPADTVLDPY